MTPRDAPACPGISQRHCQNPPWPVRRPYVLPVAVAAFAPADRRRATMNTLTSSGQPHDAKAFAFRRAEAPFAERAQLPL